jgi:3-methyladenine DNA glycosylase AlkD
MRRLGRTIGKDHALALALFRTRIPDFQIIAALVAEPERLTGRQMEQWVRAFGSWDVCDQVCLNLFCRSPLAWDKVRLWATRPDEWTRRAAFALLACLAVHDEAAPNRRFISALPWIAEAAGDDRNFVRKAVNWALRQIGKRNPRLRSAAIRTARAIARRDSRSARWIASDALRELAPATFRAPRVRPG